MHKKEYKLTNTESHQITKEKRKKERGSIKQLTEWQ